MDNLFYGRFFFIKTYFYAYFMFRLEEPRNTKTQRDGTLQKLFPVGDKKVFKIKHNRGGVVK